MMSRLRKKSTDFKAVFAQRFAVLRTAMEPEIDELTAQLYSAELIGRETRDNDTGTKANKAERVLRCVEKHIDRKFDDFVCVLEQIPSLRDIATSLRESAATFLPPYNVELNTSGGRSQLCVAAVDGCETSRMNHKLAKLQLTNSHVVRQDSELLQESSGTMPMASEMLPGVRYVAGNRQAQTHLSEAAALRHASQTAMPSVLVGATDELGTTLRSFHRLSEMELLQGKHLPASILLSTTESRAPAVGQDHLSHLARNFNFDVTSPLYRSVSSSSSEGDFEDSLMNRCIEQEMVMLERVQIVEREKFILEKQLKRKNKQLKQSQERFIEENRRCNILCQKLEQQEAENKQIKQQYKQKIKLLERQIDYYLGQTHCDDKTSEDSVQTPESTTLIQK